MSYTQSSLNIKDAGGTSRLTNAYNDGTQFNFVHGLLDGLGNLVTTTNGLPINLAQVGAATLAFGSAVSASSIPVVIASDQSGVQTVAPIPSISTSSTYAHTSTTTAYAYGELWANNATAGSVTFGTITVAKAANQAVTIKGGSLSKSGTGTTNALFRVHLFDASPGAPSVADYGTFQGGVALTNWIGSFDCAMNEAGSDVAKGGLTPTTTDICTIPVSGAQTLYYVYEVRGAYTPTSAETLTLTLFVQ